MIEFILNDRKIATDQPSGALLLDFVRYEKRLTGTKIGCREGDCGACTVLIGSWQNGQMKYEQVTSCLTALGNVHGRHVVTIEGLNMEGMTPVQQAMVDESGTQCGFCTVGFVVSLTAYCLQPTAPSPQHAIAAIDGNICRCTGYKAIGRAAQKITEALAGKDVAQPVDWLVERNFIPTYFQLIPDRLKAIRPRKQKQPTGIVLGGGTDLYVQKHDELAHRELEVMADRPEWRYVRMEGGFCRLGGGTTVSDIATSDIFQKHFPRLGDHLKLVSSSPIRNISTLAGNFVNASPIGDLTAFFLALDAKITLTEEKQNRSIFLKDFYKGYKELDKKAGEIITEISFHIPSPNSHFNFEKVSKRTHLDIASVNTAALITLREGIIQQAHISAGGIGPIPTYLHKSCAFLQGKPLSPKTIQSANDVLQAEISPISDVRGTKEYKRLMLRQLFYAHFIGLFPGEISLKGLLEEE